VNPPLNELTEIWVYLSATPLLGLTLTLLAYQGALLLQRRCNGHALANPVLISVVLLVALLALTGTPYATYFDGAQFVHFLLGPATVALAIPLYAQWARLRRLLLPIGVALIAGSLTASLSAVLAGHLTGGSLASLISLAPKSATTPIAMGIAERLGGLPSLTAVMVILTGILGAMIGPSLLHRSGITDPAATGFAMGVTSHGIGTARAFQDSEQTGAFAALAMGLNGLMTALLLPWLLPPLLKWLS
jgi:predicted murein hydrolase (TIGR00659 family)